MQQNVFLLFIQHRTNYILLMEYSDRKCVFTKFTFSYTHFFLFRRGALIVRRLCVLLDAERVYRQFSLNLEQEQDLDFASVMVQVFLSFLILFQLLSLAIAMLLKFENPQCQNRASVFNNPLIFV